MPLALITAMEKSSDPQRFLQQLGNFYQSTQDVRLLDALADGVLGHSAAEIYPFLQESQQVFQGVQDETAVDSVVRRIAAVRGRAKTEIDRRALYSCWSCSSSAVQWRWRWR